MYDVSYAEKKNEIMNNNNKFFELGKKQVILGQAIEDMKKIQSELSQNSSTAKTIGNAVYISYAVIMPLNVILNAFDLKAANNLYQRIVK